MKYIFSIVLIAFLFQGCTSRDFESYDKFDSISNAVYPVGTNKDGHMVYVKGVRIKTGSNSLGDVFYQTLYLYCDKKGNLLGSGNISFEENHGKTRTAVSVQ